MVTGETTISATTTTQGSTALYRRTVEPMESLDEPWPSLPRGWLI